MSLSEALGSANKQDPQVASARAQLRAVQQRLAQSQALFLPTVNASASYGQQWSTINANPTVNYASQGLTLSVTQPLFRLANFSALEQGRLSVTQSEAVVAAAQQDLLLRVAQAYFEILISQDALITLRAQERAIGLQFEAAKRNFEVARFDLATAQEIAAENDLRIKRIALDQLVGRSGVAPKGLGKGAALPTPAPSDPEAWASQADGAHPSVRKARLGLEVARLETQKARAAESYTVDAVGSVGATRSSGSSASLPGITKSATVGVQLNWPLYTGGATQNRIKETLALEDKSRNDLDAARRAVAQATRQAYFGVQSGLAQVKALEAAESSSQLALEATQLGYRVGVRVNLDVLNAQTQLFQTRRDLAKARYDVILGGLRLRLASGQLTPADVASVNALLDK